MLIITVPSLVKTRLVWLVKKVRTAFFVMASVNQPGKFHWSYLNQWLFYEHQKEAQKIWATNHTDVPSTLTAQVSVPISALPNIGSLINRQNYPQPRAPAQVGRHIVAAALVDHTENRHLSGLLALRESVPLVTSIYPIDTSPSEPGETATRQGASRSQNISKFMTQCFQSFVVLLRPYYPSFCNNFCNSLLYTKSPEWETSRPKHF